MASPPSYNGTDGLAAELPPLAAALHGLVPPPAGGEEGVRLAQKMPAGPCIPMD